MARIPAELGLTAEEFARADVDVVEHARSDNRSGGAGQRHAALVRMGSGAPGARERRARRCRPHLEEVRWLMGTKYSGGHGETQSTERVRYPQTAGGRSAQWVVFEPSRLITWDNHKLPKR